MMILGKKIGMTQVYDNDGRIVPVTVIQAGPCTVMQVKTTETDGYEAVQMGIDNVKKSRQIKSQIGHASKANDVPKKFVREFRFEGSPGEYKQGDKVTVEVLAEAKHVDVVGTSKGKGYAGVMKRHGFGGFPGSHGTERKHRAGGSIGSHASDRGHGGNVKKGKRMSGHMGNVRVTSKNHALVSIDAEKNLLIVKGSVPGPAGGYVMVKESKV
ncbi:MAG: 50S ribosomal protein L3 [Sedimentisphaerales bacterium]|nr:50S ribosomal protein L3 [Sedimentisphaerales bacterium]